MTEAQAERPPTWRMFDALPTGVCIATPSGRIVYANAHLHELLGYPYGELEGEDADLLHGGDGVLPVPGLPLQGKGGRERRYRCRDGEFVWVVEAISPFQDDGGHAYELRTVTDVSHHRRAEASLRDQLIMKEVLFETLPVPVFIKDEEGRFADCNDAFERYTGLHRRAVIEKTSFELLEPRLAKVHVDMDRDLLVNWGQRSYEESVPHADGIPRRARVSKAVYRDNEGEIGGIVGVIHDLAEDQPNEARLQTILEQSPIGVSVSRRDNGIVIFANTRFAELVGLPRERVVGSLARDYYVDDHQRERVVERLKTSGSVVNMEVQFRAADGSTFWTLFTVNHAVIQGLPVNLAWIYDYTERRNMEEALRDMASKDPLTGIFNRRSFMELARQQLARSHRFNEPMSVVVLDVDHFKKINDSYGHATGDDALRMVAGACSTILREYDILGRLGGEEFVVVLPGATPDESRVVAERLRRHIARMPVPGPEGRFYMTASIGIAGIEEPGDTLEKAIHRSDLALYRAKRDGRNRVVVYESGM
ncbi:MAG TPA: diguanylate cyclase [Azospirillum sp.]|nr:diguanylate cyclase [Azospirillum sp.]